MNFKDLSIRRDWEGRLKGKLTTEATIGNIELNLTEDQCRDILRVCATSLVVAAKEVATELTAEAFSITAKASAPAVSNK